MIVIAVAAAAAAGAWMGIRHGAARQRAKEMEKARQRHVAETMQKIAIELVMLEEIIEELHDRMLEEEFDIDEYQRSLADHPSKPLTDDERDAFYSLVANEDDE